MNTAGKRALVLAAMLGMQGMPVAALDAQSARGAESVQLVVRPHVGDTLWLLMEQSIEVRASAAVAGPRRTRPFERPARMQLFAHTTVESGDLAATTMIATTDSMLLTSATSSAVSAPTGASANDEPTARRMFSAADGRQLRVRVAPDGAMRINDPPPSAIDLGSTLSAMPGMLPDRPVRVGDQWDRDIPLPSVPINGFRADGVLRTRFRLDSLTRRGRQAWISMEGTLQRSGGTRELPVGTRAVSEGSVRGTLVVDRDRGWIVDARTVIDVQVEPTIGAAGATPFDLRILQRVRAR